MQGDWLLSLFGKTDYRRMYREDDRAYDRLEYLEKHYKDIKDKVSRLPAAERQRIVREYENLNKYEDK